MRQERLLETASVTGGTPFSVQTPPGRYLGFLIRLYGTTDTAQTLTLDDIGTIRVERNGGQVIGNDFEFFFDYTERIGGWPLPPTGSAATAESVNCIVPFSYFDLPNSMEVLSRNELVLQIDPSSTLATRFGSNAISMDFVAITDDEIPEMYQLRIATQDFVSTAASQVLRQRLNAVNLAAVLLDDTGADIGTVQLEVDKRIVLARMDDEIVRELNMIEMRAEATANPLVIVRVARGPELGAYVNEEAELEIVTDAAGTIPVTLMYLLPSPEGRSQLSVSRTNAARARHRAEAQAKLKAAF